MGPLTQPSHLRAFRRFLDTLGAPQRDLRVVHLAGTKGKGSTATLLAEALAHRGQRVGLFRSPHVDDIRERITVAGQWIAPGAFARQGERVLRTLGPIPARPDAGFRTFFECLLAIALCHFAQRRVDWAILETGLGGRLDATNVIAPDLTIITALGVDHTRVLGRDPRGIAREKAGILKRGVPCLLAPQPRGAPRGMTGVIRERAAALRVPLIEVARRWRGEIERHRLDGLRVRLDRRGEARRVVLPRGGLSAVPAVMTAMAALEALGLLGEARRAAEIFTWPLPGRFEVVRRRPPVILDGAHCPLSARSVTASLTAVTRGPRRVCLAMMEDKDHAGFIRALGLKSGDAVALPALREPRAMEADALAALVAREAPGCEARVFASLGPALRWLAARRPAGTLLVTGTFHHLAPARRALSRA